MKTLLIIATVYVLSIAVLIVEFRLVRSRVRKDKHLGIPKEKPSQISLIRKGLD